MQGHRAGSYDARDRGVQDRTSRGSLEPLRRERADAGDTQETIAVAAQRVAFDAIRPGATCADVDSAVMRYFGENDLVQYWRQRTGHGIGLRNREAPFLDVGDPTPLEAGMVFTIELGLYDPDVGGFRHSDTVAVTEDGVDILTDYPIDIESLTIPA